MLKRERKKLAKKTTRRKLYEITRNRLKGRKKKPGKPEVPEAINGAEWYSQLKEKEAKNKPSAPKRESALKKLMKVFTRGNK